MTTTDTARPGVDLSAMMAAHDAFRRDLVQLMRTAYAGNLADPRQRAAVVNGWQVFRRQLFLHHRGEDTFLWPPMRAKLTGDPAGLAVLDAMSGEHQEIGPLVAAVDRALADPAAAGLGEAVDNLVAGLTLHLGHEERDALPLVDEVLDAADWAEIVAALRAAGDVSDAMEMVPWLLTGLSPDRTAEVLAFYPPFVVQAYAESWKPKYDAVPKWTA
jgi:hemerythrin-like domain-containing protein